MKNRELLRKAYETAAAFLETVAEQPVGRPVNYAALLAAMGRPLPARGEDPQAALESLIETVTPALVATPGPRYFGFVVGGAQPVSVAAEWLAAAWDQNAGAYSLSPPAAAAEEIVRTWMLELFGLPGEMSLGVTTGCTMANFTGLASARHALLLRAGWDVERQGLFGAPELAVATSDESHVSIFAALQMLGLGRERVTRIPTDGQGRMRADELRAALARIGDRPVLVCAQAGNVNTGAFDPIAEIAPAVHERGGWLHVDGAFGLWAAASPRLRGLTAGIEAADSLSVDGHKWLNVPQDSGLVFVRDSRAHQNAMTLSAPYYATGAEPGRDNHNWVPEASRRARGFALYVALLAMGREGIAREIERGCDLARRMADRLTQNPRVQLLNDVVLNQAMVRFHPKTGPKNGPKNGTDVDGFTAEIIRRVQEDGACWAGGTIWRGMHAMRLSVSNWTTTEADIDRSADAILACLRDADEA